MTVKAWALLPACLLFAGTALAATALPPDRPVHIGTVDAVCTGVGLDSRLDPAWSSYPLKIEIAGRAGQYLGDVALTISRDDQEVVAVQCDGPWMLFRLLPGRYQVKAQTEGQTVQSGAVVPGTGQGRIILRFPELGGQTAVPLTGDSHE